MPDVFMTYRRYASSGRLAPTYPTKCRLTYRYSLSANTYRELIVIS